FLVATHRWVAFSMWRQRTNGMRYTRSCRNVQVTNDVGRMGPGPGGVARWMIAPPPLPQHCRESRTRVLDGGRVALSYPAGERSIVDCRLLPRRDQNVTEVTRQYGRARPALPIGGLREAVADDRSSLPRHGPSCSAWRPMV